MKEITGETLPLPTLLSKHRRFRAHCVEKPDGESKVIAAPTPIKGSANAGDGKRPDGCSSAPVRAGVTPAEAFAQHLLF